MIYFITGLVIGFGANYVISHPEVAAKLKTKVVELWNVVLSKFKK